jgi:uncharacterized protein
VFVAIVLGIWTLLHLYLYWRLSGVFAVARLLPRPWLLATLALLWLAYPLGRMLGRTALAALGHPLEVIGAVWLGTLFLLVVVMLACDLLTGFGLLFRAAAPAMRGWAAVVGLVLAGVALLQGLRGPVVRDYEVPLPGLPAERDGTVLVEISDLHLGSLLGSRWLARRVAEVESLHPDIVVVDGDLVDGNVPRVSKMLPELRKLHAPSGVWAVTGNHEFYAGVDRSVALFAQAGFRTLRDRWESPFPGLVIAGVDDLTARRQFGLDGHPIEKALAGRPPGATILLSHTPWQAELAARLGAGLMLSGHTHDGQIWPFGYLVSLTYPLLGGRYVVGGMPVIVCRGTGTWGPPMRLWRPSEIVRITLRSPSATPSRRAAASRPT